MAALVSLVAAAQALRLWDWRPGVPLSLAADSPTVLLQVRAVLDGHWYSTNRLVGAPYGLNQSWFTTADALNFATVRVLGLFTDSAATASAVFFVLGFPAAALSAYWLGRQLALSRPAAVVVGVLFSVLPNHQEWFDHLWLASYWMVPLAVWLVLRVARGDRLFPTSSELRAGGGRSRQAWWLGARTLLVIAAVGLSNVYYVAFSLILLATVLVLRLATGTRAARLAPGALAAVAVAALSAASLVVATRGRADDLVTGALPATRGIGESEVYAGKLIELVLPWHEHRLEPLRFLTNAYGIAAPAGVEHPTLGLCALVGVTAILGRCVASLLTGRRLTATWGLLAALTLVSLAFYTKGGLGSVVALFLTPQIRTWSRFVVLIALFGLLALGLWLTRLGRRRGRTAAWVAATAVLAVGILDQTNPGEAPDYSRLAGQQRELSAYTDTLAGAVGRSCPVFQLPVVAFPEEAPPGSMADYEHLLPALASPTSLSWSYGAIRGTARADWQLALPVGDQRRLLVDVAAAGFCAVSIDRDGYAGSSDPTDTTTDVLGQPVATAMGENLVAYDLGPLTDALGPGDLQRQREAVLRPVVASLAGSLVDTSDGTPSQLTGPTAVVTVSNLGARPVATTITFDLVGVGPAERTVTISGAGVQQQVVRVSDRQPLQVTVPVTARPGRNEVTLESTGGVLSVPGTEGRDQAALRVRDLRLTTNAGVNAASLQQLLAATPPSLR